MDTLHQGLRINWHMLHFEEHIRQAREALQEQDRRFSLRQVAARGYRTSLPFQDREGHFSKPPSEDVIVKLARS